MQTYHKVMQKIFFSGLIILVAMALSLSRCSAQSATPTKPDSAFHRRAQNIYFELGGAGGIFSVDYDTRLTNRRNGIGMRAGLGFLPGIFSPSVLTIPVQVNYLLGKQSNFLEIGGGFTYSSAEYLGSVIIGYRHQPIQGGFNFRVNVTPLIEAGKVYPFPGMSFGYSFK